MLTNFIADRDSILAFEQREYSEKTRLRVVSMEQFSAFGRLDSAQVIALTIEMIGLFEWNLPAFVVRHARELFELSNTLGSDRYWANYATSTSVRNAIEQLVVTDVSKSDLLRHDSTELAFDWEAFKQLIEDIVPPQCSKDDEGNWKFTITTWTPRGGIVVTWDGEISQSGELTLSPHVCAVNVGPLMAL